MEIKTTCGKKIEFLRKIPFRRLDGRTDFDILAINSRGVTCHYRKEDLILDGGKS